MVISYMHGYTSPLQINILSQTLYCFIDQLVAKWKEDIAGIFFKMIQDTRCYRIPKSCTGSYRISKILHRVPTSFQNNILHKILQDFKYPAQDPTRFQISCTGSCVRSNRISNSCAESCRTLGRIFTRVCVVYFTSPV